MDWFFIDTPCRLSRGAQYSLKACSLARNASTRTPLLLGLPVKTKLKQVIVYISPYLNMFNCHVFNLNMF